MLMGAPVIKEGTHIGGTNRDRMSEYRRYRAYKQGLVRKCIHESGPPLWTVQHAKFYSYHFHSSSTYDLFDIDEFIAAGISFHFHQFSSPGVFAISSS